MREFLANRFRGLHNADEGQALVLVALGLMVLMMMAALGLDVGYLHYQKQQMQKAADAAAIAGATALSYSQSNPTDVTNAAQADAKANGFTNTQNGVTVTVNNPPQTQGDPFYNNSNYVEVIIAKQQPTFFMKVTSFGMVNVQSRAVANAHGSADGCIYALDPTDDKTFLVDGNVTIQTTCSIYVNSNADDALTVNGASATVAVGGPNQNVGIGVVGNYKGKSGDFSPEPVTGIPPFNDPLGNVPTPTCSGPGSVNNGVYQQGNFASISITGNSNVTFMPGTYCITGGGLSLAGGGTITGTGVTFYLTKTSGGSYNGLSITGNSNMTLSAPTSGPQAGVLFFQDRSVATNAATSSFDGTSGGTFTGAFYFPTTTVQFKGTPGATSNSPIVAYELEFKGNATIADDAVVGSLSSIPGAILVE